MHLQPAEGSHWIPACPSKVAVDKPTKVQEIRLEILPVDSPAGPQFGRGGDEFVLFDVKPTIEDLARIRPAIREAPSPCVPIPVRE